MNIRTAQPADAASIIEFNQAMALETEGKTLDADTISAGVTAVLDDDRKGFYVVTTAEDQIVGSLMVTFEWSDWRNAWFWWIQSVYVLPQTRGRGVYRQMYDFVKGLAAESGDVCGFRLYVEHDNTNAQKVYDAVGMSRSHYLMFEEETA